MTSKINGKYLGKKRIELTHEDSGTVIITDAPKDNNGEGNSFSPTDLCASSLLACVVTILAIKAESMGLADFEKVEFNVEKIMASDPRRIGEIRAQVRMPASVSERDRKVLEAAARTCPVHHSLSHDLNADIQFLYEL